MTPSVASPQPLGTPVTWTITATDSSPNSLTFQFNVANGAQPFARARDFNIGTLSAGVWTSQPFIWATIAGEGIYTVQVIAKDFTSGETATQTALFTLTPLATVAAVVNPTANPLVALYSAPSCPAGANIRAAFSTGANPTVYTNWVACNPPISVNFYIAGMLASATYSIYAEVQLPDKVLKGGRVNFTTGALPAELAPPNILPSLTVNTAAGAQTDTADSLLLWGFTNTVVPVATDLAGNIMWYYAGGINTVVTRPLTGGTMLTFQNGLSWNSPTTEFQLLREIDLAGNTFRETNTGIIANQLLALGATDAGACLPVPAPKTGTTCLNNLSHDAIRYYAGGQEYTALLVHIEKMFPPGTQGSNPKGPPVDILSEMLVVLNSQWQVVWYYDSFQHLDIKRPAVLGEFCTTTSCTINLLLSTYAYDWTHGNTIYYIESGGDFMVSLRNQDWLIKIAYDNGKSSGKIVWRMGPEGNFTFNNIDNDPWPWFSHQHEPGFQTNGANPLTLFDNGNTRVFSPPLGLGSNCGPSDCNSRGMALTVDETPAQMQVTPVISVDLGVYANSDGAAQLLAGGNYFFQPGHPTVIGIEILPTPGTLTGTQVLNILSPNDAYRTWQMSNLYTAPSS